jgi:hypothetical protein
MTRRARRPGQLIARRLTAVTALTPARALRFMILFICCNQNDAVWPRATDTHGGQASEPSQPIVLYSPAPPSISLEPNPTCSHARQRASPGAARGRHAARSPRQGGSAVRGRDRDPVEDHVDRPPCDEDRRCLREAQPAKVLWTRRQAIDPFQITRRAQESQNFARADRPRRGDHAPGLSEIPITITHRGRVRGPGLWTVA